MRWVGLFATVLAASISSVSAASEFSSTADWFSTDGEPTASGTLVDVNRDGWLDYVALQERLVVYYNRGDGLFATEPDWESNDTTPFTYDDFVKIDVADVNGDGWPDVAVPVPGVADDHGVAAKLYLNHEGTLGSLPEWESGDIAIGRACAFGDVNNDGRPDLAVATGADSSRFGEVHQQTLVYVNADAGLPAEATWRSVDTDVVQTVAWIDADQDGWLDLVGFGRKTVGRIYRNSGGALETTNAWQTDATVPEAEHDGVDTGITDLDGDGIADLVVADGLDWDHELQEVGSGRFLVFEGLPSGFYSTVPQPLCVWDGGEYCFRPSSVWVGDADGDGDADIVTGEYDSFYTTAVKFHENPGDGIQNRGYEVVNSYIEGVHEVCLGDVDRSSLKTARVTYVADGRRLFWMPRRPIEALYEVRVDGAILTPDQFAFSRSNGWLTVGISPTSSVEVEFGWSSSPDIMIASADYIACNQLHLNIGYLFKDGFDSGDVSQWGGHSPVP